MKENLKKTISTHLGQGGSYAVYTDKFDSSLLVPMPRKEMRDDWGITGKEFVGYDVWHCHEATFLLDNGLPVAGTLKIVYPADTEYMVESKSFKLYLNTFDMCKMGPTFKTAIINYEEQILNDLSTCLQVEKEKIAVSFFTQTEYERYEGNPAKGYVDLYFEISEEDLENLAVTDYKGQEKHFRVEENTRSDNVKWFTNILRSRCRHTKQKDTGTAFFHIKTTEGYVDPVSLLKEVIALREVNEFHEFCCEKLFKTIIDHPDVEDCVVMLLYSRRGSLDINPVRASKESLISPLLIDPEVYTKKTMGQ